jgi:lysine-specific demethylase 8
MSDGVQVAGRRTVPVELGAHYLQEGWGTRLMTLDQFIRQHVLTAAPAAAAAAAGPVRVPFGE